MTAAESFGYPGGSAGPGETAEFRYTVTETYLGDPVRIPVTVVNGVEPGPTVCLSAASHGDELNGVETVREAALAFDAADLHGTLVCLPVLNVPGFVAQQRYLPIFDRDLNRSFPGDPESTHARRIAHAIFETFVSRCDLVIDFHTSTRGRSNVLHVRARMDDASVARLARAFGSAVILDGEGAEGTLRREATEDGVPTITVEMGEAHRFQREFIDAALDGVRSVLVEFGLLPEGSVRWPGWRAVVSGSDEKTWIRADTGGIVEMAADRGDFVRAGDPIATIADPFNTDGSVVTAPFDGLVVGVLQNPVVHPGNPLCHLVSLDDDARPVAEGAGTFRSATGADVPAGEAGDRPGE